MIGHYDRNINAGPPTGVALIAQNLQISPTPSLSKQVNHFLDHLEKASEDEISLNFGKYRTTIAHELDFQKLYFISYPEVEDLLETAVAESIDSLTLFTLPPLQQQQGAAIIFSQELLRQVNKKFNFHGLFNISIPSAEDGTEVKMKFLVIGQGKFIVGYDRNTKIKHSDYDFATGKYDYRELFVMDAKTDSNGNPGLYNIKALSEPDGKLEWMKGPLNVDIHSMSLTPDSGGKSMILIQYDLSQLSQRLLEKHA